MVEHDDVRRLLTHMEWADAATWTTALGTTAGGDPRLLDLFYHLHVVQLVYLQMWRGLAPTAPERGAFDGLSSVAAWARTYYDDLRAFLAGLEPGQLATDVTMPWAGEIAKRYGKVVPTSLGDTVLQVVLHSTYHRAQIATRVRELGGSPQVTDFIAWIWQGRPAPDWPA